MGYRFSFGVGKLKGQNSPHFYMRIVPKYKENYGFSYYFKYSKKGLR